MDTQPFLELIEAGITAKEHVTLLSGQALAGIVTKAIGTEAVEARSQTCSRIIIRLDQGIAVAIG